jgi:hypothetical protein
MSNSTDLSLNDSKSFFSKIKGLFSNKIVAKVFRIIKIIIFVFLICSIILLFDSISYLKNEIKLHHMYYHTEGNVDLSVPELQKINNNFDVGRFNITPHLDGIKVNGIILNTESVGHSNSEFEITVNEQRQEFNIKNIPASYASEFNVFIPNVPTDKARWGNIKYIKGQVNYRKF